MKDPFQIFSELLTEPIALGPDHTAIFIARLQSLIDHPSSREMIMKEAEMAGKAKSERPLYDVYGEPIPQPEYDEDTETQIIPVNGKLALDVPTWAKRWMDMSDVYDIESDLNAASRNPSVKRIMMDVDSPGGWSVAGEMLANSVEAASRRKPVLSWSGPAKTMCSAAYLGAAPSQMILASKFSTVGNIGTVYAVSRPNTEYFKMDVFASGKYKSIGLTELSDDQKEFIQSMVDKIGASFRARVKHHRPEVDKEDMQGQWFDGSDAAAKGLTAGLAESRRNALEKFVKLY